MMRKLHVALYIVASTGAMTSAWWFTGSHYGWSAIGPAMFFGLLPMTIGVPAALSAAKFVRVRQGTGAGGLLAGVLLTLPTFLGVIPGRIEEAAVRRQARPVIEDIARIGRAQGRFPKKWNDARLPQNSYYIHYEHPEAFALCFSRATQPSSVIIYSSIGGWSADD